MRKKAVCKWITISGVLLIWTIKWGIRPYFHFDVVTTFLLGVAPNLIGSFLLPFAGYWLLTRFMDLQITSLLRWFCLTCFCLLIINEYLQKIPFFGRTFDYFDMLASAVGLSVAYQVINKMMFLKNLPVQLPGGRS